MRMEHLAQMVAAPVFTAFAVSKPIHVHPPAVPIPVQFVVAITVRMPSEVRFSPVQVRPVSFSPNLEIVAADIVLVWEDILLVALDVHMVNRRYDGTG